MARPINNGLRYFPKDTGYFQDRKIRSLIANFGCDGTALYDYILCAAYGDKGYYVEEDDYFKEMASIDLKISLEKIELILAHMLRSSMLLDSQRHSTVKALTSRGIQKQWQESMKAKGQKRDVIVDKALWLLKPDETQGFIKFTQNEDYAENNPSFSQNNPDKSENNSTNKKKRKKSILCAEQKNCSTPEEAMITLPLNDGSEYPVLKTQVKEWESLYPAVDVQQQLRNMRGWLLSNPRNRKTESGINRFINGWLRKEQNQSRKEPTKSIYRELD